MMEGEFKRSRFPSRSWSISAESSGQAEVEVREDEEQGAKLQEIMELLLAAGYFRARIKGLSAFDMVVGGMTWCIEVCNVDIDVDLLFQENLTIGQKIALTEKIVAVLPKMQCPYLLEPHQIQGLDSIHIYPVVQWLVKKAIETRQEVGDYIRAYAVSQFNKSHATPQDTALNAMKESMSSTLQALQSSYKPQRQYRHHAPHKIKEEELRVQTTLLEYGRQYGWVQAAPGAKDARSPSQAETTGGASTEEGIPASHIEKLMSGMSAMEEQEGKLAASVVGGIVGLQSSEIQQIASEYASKQAELSMERGEYVGGAQQQHMRTLASLKKQLALRKEELEKITKEHEAALNNYNKTREKLKELQDKEAKLLAGLRKFEEMETSENKSILQQLRSLVIMNEQLKQHEQEFRSHCLEEKERLTKSIEHLKSSTEEGTSENEERSQLIVKQYEADKLNLRKVRLLLANKNREIAAIQRKIDEVPSRAELSQYQRRFVELYNQVAAKHKETKQFYTLYNTLDDTRMYLSKEVNLLNSILDSFTEAMSSPATKEQFLSQFEQIVEGIKQNKKKVEKKKQEEKMKRDQLNDYYLDLIEKQRLYFKAIKDFKEECRHNEILLAKLKERSQ